MDTFFSVIPFGWEHLLNAAEASMGLSGGILFTVFIVVLAVLTLIGGIGLNERELRPRWGVPLLVGPGLILLLAVQIGGRRELAEAKAWIARSGNERLQLIVEEGLLLEDHNYDLYMTERIETEFKGWVLVEDLRKDSATWPTTGQFNLLKAARANTTGRVEMMQLTLFQPGQGLFASGSPRQLGNFPVTTVRPFGVKIAYDPSGWLRQSIRAAGGDR